MKCLIRLQEVKKEKEFEQELSTLFKTDTSTAHKREKAFVKRMIKKP